MGFASIVTFALFLTVVSSHAETLQRPLAAIALIEPNTESNCDFWCQLAKNIPETIKVTVTGHMTGVMALVIVMTTLVVLILTPPDAKTRARVVYVFLFAGILFVVGAFRVAGSQQDRLIASQPVSAQQNPQLKPQESSAQKPSSPSENPQPQSREPKPTTRQEWCAEDPDTKIPYSNDITFRPGDPPYRTGRTRGGDANTPGSEWVFNWTAPGPVYAVTAKQTGWWEQIDSCSANGNVAHCEGWINGGNAPIIVTAKWKQPCTVGAPQGK